MAARIVTLNIGGRDVEVMVRPMATLQNVLRYQLGYMSVKEGCRQGGCGSCAVLVDGEPMMSCLLPAEDVVGRKITVLETITPAHGLDPIQTAFIERGAFQCGYCSPGMITVTKALLEHNPRPTRAQIIEALGGNFCRCTGYEPILAAVEDAAKATAEA
jgi:carbon-monoxide dehydrogenase small subunit